MNLILKGYWSNNPISIDEVIQNPELVLRVPVGKVTISADVDKAYVDEQDSLLGNEFATALQALDDKKANATAVTQALSTKADLIGGVIPANQLPSFNVDSVGSVNGQTGVVVLDADDVGATTQVYVDTQDNLIINSLTLKADTNYVDTQDGLLQDQIDLKADAIAVSQSLDTKADAMATSQSLALKADLVGGVIPSYQLPSYVDVLNFPDLASFPVVGEDGKIYIAEDVNKTYRWGGSSYVEIGGGGVALGETSSTAYRGDNGKIAYDHSQSQGNPHNTTTSDISEGTKLFFTEPRVNQTVLTGLNTSTASPALATDQLLAAIGKLQAQINNIAPPTWVSAASIGSVMNAFLGMEFAKIDGNLWVRGRYQSAASISTNTILFVLADAGYRIEAPQAPSSDLIIGSVQANTSFTSPQYMDVVAAVNPDRYYFRLRTRGTFSAVASPNYAVIQPTPIGKLLTP